MSKTVETPDVEVSYEYAILRADGNVHSEDIFVFRGKHGVIRLESSRAALMLSKSIEKTLAGKKSNVRLVDVDDEVIVLYGERGCARFLNKTELLNFVDLLKNTIDEWIEIEENWESHMCLTDDCDE
jgi:hypothetical protein